MYVYCRIGNNIATDQKNTSEFSENVVDKSVASFISQWINNKQKNLKSYCQWKNIVLLHYFIRLIKPRPFKNKFYVGKITTNFQGGRFLWSVSDRNKIARNLNLKPEQP